MSTDSKKRQLSSNIIILSYYDIIILFTNCVGTSGDVVGPSNLGGPRDPPTTYSLGGTDHLDYVSPMDFTENLNGFWIFGSLLLFLYQDSHGSNRRSSQLHV